MGENQIFPKFLLGNLKQFLGKQPPKKWEHHFPVTKDSFKEIKKIFLPLQPLFGAKGGGFLVLAAP